MEALGGAYFQVYLSNVALDICEAVLIHECQPFL